MRLFSKRWEDELVCLQTVRVGEVLTEYQEGNPSTDRGGLVKNKIGS